MGRFLGEDPIFTPGSLYSYVANSPLNRTDPSGEALAVLLPVLLKVAELTVAATLGALTLLAGAELISNVYHAKDTEADIDKHNEDAFDKSLVIPKEKPTYPDADDDGENIRKTRELIRRKSGRDPIESIDKSMPKKPVIPRPEPPGTPPGGVDGAPGTMPPNRKPDRCP